MENNTDKPLSPKEPLRSVEDQVAHPQESLAAEPAQSASPSDAPSSSFTSSPNEAPAAAVDAHADKIQPSSPPVPAQQQAASTEAHPVPGNPTKAESNPVLTANEVNQPGNFSNETPADGGQEQNAAVLAESRKHTRRSFAIAGLAAIAGYNLYEWIIHRPSREMQPSPFRDAFNLNAALSRKAFDERGLAPTYPLRRAENLRVNGVYGLKMDLVPESYRLQVVGVRDDAHHPQFTRDVTAWQYRYVAASSHEDQGHDTKTPPPGTARKMAPAGMVEQEEKLEARGGRLPRGREEAGESFSTLAVGTPGLLLTMQDILRLPRYELVTQFKCIEGWSQIVHWAGVRMADFLEAYPPALINGREPRYVYMETPDGDYYTGYDLKVCRHPQTLLVTEMMGAPLTQFHGAPLRLHMPTKYGYKQIKRIGLISYTNVKPDDYWTKLGYDWYAGL